MAQPWDRLKPRKALKREQLKGVTVLEKDGSYPTEDGRRGKLNRKTPPYLGRKGAGGAMCQARIVWADCVIRKKAKWLIK